MKLVDEIPQKEAIVHLLKGEVVEEPYKVSVGGVVLSPWIESKLRKRCVSYNCLQEGVDDKEMYLRGRESPSGIHWFGLVSGQFKPISVEKVSAQLGDVVKKEFVRYDLSLERFQIGYVLKEGSPTVMAYVDSGDFGVYGGNGESALHYGIAIKDDAQDSWALFQNKREISRDKPVIHRVNFKSIDAIAREQKGFAQSVESMWKANRERCYAREEVENFAAAYVARCMDIFGHVLQGVNGDGIKGDELMSRLQQEASRLCGRAQLGLEALVGEMVMKYN
jgi:hypothetical protein